MFKIITKIKNRFKYELNRIIEPQMLSGFYRYDGVYLSNVRYSNTTFIGCKKRLNISDNVFIGHHNVIDACNEIVIKEGCQITNFISILTHSTHISIRLYGKEFSKFNDLKGAIEGQVYIGEYTFVGPHSVIMPNTHIGKGSIVNAYSYVEGEYPAFSIIKGNPARVIGDTRDIDKKYLENYTELEDYYCEWAEKNNMPKKLVR